MSEITLRIEKSLALHWGNEKVRKYLDERGFDLSGPLKVREICGDLEYIGYRKRGTE